MVVEGALSRTFQLLAHEFFLFQNGYKRYGKVKVSISDLASFENRKLWHDN
jgi:hypothetical protein